MPDTPVKRDTMDVSEDKDESTERGGPASQPLHGGGRRDSLLQTIHHQPGLDTEDAGSSRFHPYRSKHVQSAPNPSFKSRPALVLRLAELEGFSPRYDAPARTCAPINLAMPLTESSAETSVAAHQAPAGHITRRDGRILSAKLEAIKRLKAALPWILLDGSAPTLPNAVDLNLPLVTHLKDRRCQYPGCTDSHVADGCLARLCNKHCRLYATFTGVDCGYRRLGKRDHNPITDEKDWLKCLELREDGTSSKGMSKKGRKGATLGPPDSQPSMPQGSSSRNVPAQHKRISPISSDLLTNSRSHEPQSFENTASALSAVLAVGRFEPSLDVSAFPPADTHSPDSFYPKPMSITECIEEAEKARQKVWDDAAEEGRIPETIELDMVRYRPGWLPPKEDWEIVFGHYEDWTGYEGADDCQ